MSQYRKGYLFEKKTHLEIAQIVSGYKNINSSSTIHVSESTYAGSGFNIPFLLLDECTSNLDQELATAIVSMIKNKNN